MSAAVRCERTASAFTPNRPSSASSWTVPSKRRTVAHCQSTLVRRYFGIPRARHLAETVEGCGLKVLAMFLSERVPKTRSIAPVQWTVSTAWPGCPSRQKHSADIPG